MFRKSVVVIFSFLNERTTLNFYQEDELTFLSFFENDINDLNMLNYALTLDEMSLQKQMKYQSALRILF